MFTVLPAVQEIGWLQRINELQSLIMILLKVFYRARFGSMYTKIGTIQRRSAWPLCKDDTQIHEVFHIFFIAALL